MFHVKYICITSGAIWQYCELKNQKVESGGQMAKTLQQTQTFQTGITSLEYSESSFSDVLAWFSLSWEMTWSVQNQHTCTDLQNSKYNVVTECISNRTNSIIAIFSTLSRIYQNNTQPYKTSPPYSNLLKNKLRLIFSHVFAGSLWF